MTIKEFADKFSAPQSITVYVEIADKRTSIGGNYFCNNCLDFLELVRNQPQLAEREVSQIMFLSDSVSIYYDGKPRKPEAFYTGGGIWLSAMYIDERHYYTIDNCSVDSLWFYDHENEDDDIDFPTQNLIWEKDVTECTEDERRIYDVLRSALIEEMERCGCDPKEWE